MANLAENGGVARWITSPILGEDDWEAIKQGMEAQTDEVLKESLEEQITDLRYDLEYHTRNTIAWMIADGLLEIRFAVPKKNLSGDFHDKFGIIEDMVGNTVAFHGSQNDSVSALSNYEAYTIDCDWLSDRDAEVFAISRNGSKGSGRASSKTLKFTQFRRQPKRRLRSSEMTTIGLTHRPKGRQRNYSATVSTGSD